MRWALGGVGCNEVNPPPLKKQCVFGCQQNKNICQFDNVQFICFGCDNMFLQFKMRWLLDLCRFKVFVFSSCSLFALFSPLFALFLPSSGSTITLLCPNCCPALTRNWHSSQLAFNLLSPGFDPALTALSPCCQPAITLFSPCFLPDFTQLSPCSPGSDKTFCCLQANIFDRTGAYKIYYQ